MVASLIVEDSHFEYLRLQKGSIDRLAHDRESWHMAYEQAITKDYAIIAPHLPASCESILDVGGGLGGIDALLVRTFGWWCEVCILDGENDPPRMNLHRVTFNHMDVARDFLTKNGVERFSYFTPDKGTPRLFDLIISLGSWCFHYPPEVYLDFVKACCRPATTLIIDVRKDKPQWSAALDRSFILLAVVHMSPKFDRKVYRG